MSVLDGLFAAAVERAAAVAPDPDATADGGSDIDLTDDDLVTTATLEFLASGEWNDRR